MLKHEKIIKRMSLKDKINFLFSNNKFTNSELEDFEFPLFSISDEVVFLNKDQSRAKLSNKAIASTWNNETMRNVYSFYTKNLDAYGTFQIFLVRGNPYEANISEDYFLNTNVYLNAIDMMKENHNMSCLDLVDFNIDVDNDFETTSYTYESVLTTRQIDSVLIPTISEIEYIRDHCVYNGYIFGCTTSEEEAIKFVNKGAVLTFIEDIDIESIEAKILKAMDEYAVKFKALEDEMITQEEFDESLRNGEITSMDILDKNCNDLIELFFKLSKKRVDNGSTSTPNEKQFVPFGKKMAIQDCTDQGVILLKNENNLLPIKHKTKLAIMGDAINYGSNALVKEKNVLDYIKNYPEIIPTGYAQGYMLNHPTDAILVNDAFNLGISSDVSLVYLSVDNNGRVPTNQLTLLNTLKKNGVKIIAVLGSPITKDFSFIDYCDAALFSYFESSQMVKTILDVVLGDINPSGHLVETLLLESRTDNNPAIPTYALNLKHKLPFGFGLSYTTFEYSNLKITAQGVRFTLTNTGERDGYAVPQMYVQKLEGTHALRNRLLKGYTKVFLRAGEATKVLIPFDENTFKYFNKGENLFGVEEGTYNIYIGESYDDIKIDGSLAVEGNLYRDEKFTSVRDEKYRLLEDPLNDFIRNKKAQYSIDERLGFTKKKRIIFGSCFGGVLDLIVLIILFLYWGSTKMQINSFVLALFILLVVFSVSTLVYILLVNREEEKVVQEEETDSLTKVVDNLGNFFEESRQVFAQYKKPDEDEEEMVKEISDNPEYEEEEEEEVKQEEIERKYVANYESGDTSVIFNDFNSVEELQSQFLLYIKSKGLSMDGESLRRLWAALLSSKIIFLNSNDKGLLKDLLKYLIDYLGSNTFIQEASNKWKKTKDTLWKKTRVEFLPSNFANSLYNASRSKDCLNIIALTNVRLENLFYYFNDFIENANNPINDVKISLNETTTITLPKNICYILVPEDNSYYDNLPYYVSNIAFEVNVVLEKIEKVPSDKEFKHIKYENLLDIIAQSKEKFYLDENKWKIFDEFEDRISETDKFQIGNKATLQMEGFVSNYLETGGDVNDVIDVLFITKLIPMIKSLSLYKNDGGDKALIKLIEEVFENETTTLAVKACNRIPMEIEFVVDESNDSDDNYEEAKEEVINVISNSDDKPLEISVEDIMKSSQEVDNGDAPEGEETVDSHTEGEDNPEPTSKEVEEEPKVEEAPKEEPVEAKEETPTEEPKEEVTEENNAEEEEPSKKKVKKEKAPKEKKEKAPKKEKKSSKAKEGEGE